MAIFFHYQFSEYRLRKSSPVKDWLDKVIRDEGKISGEIVFYFVEDRELREINREFLEHDYYTDVITFDYSEDDSITGEIYISVDTVRYNSKSLGIPYTGELRRVILHGVLHLLGYNDRDKEEQMLMRKMEDKYLDKFKS